MNALTVPIAPAPPGLDMPCFGLGTWLSAPPRGDKLVVRAVTDKIANAMRARVRSRIRRTRSIAGSSKSSSSGSGATSRRRIVSAIPPAARPMMRPDTTTRTSGA